MVALRELLEVGKRILADESYARATEAAQLEQLRAAAQPRALKAVAQFLALSAAELTALEAELVDDVGENGFCVYLHAFGETFCVALSGFSFEGGEVTRVHLRPSEGYLWKCPQYPEEGREHVARWLARAQVNEQWRKRRDALQAAAFKPFTFYKVWFGEDEKMFYEVRYAGSGDEHFLTVEGDSIWIPHVVRIEKVHVGTPEEIPSHWYWCAEEIESVTVKKTPGWA